MFICYYVVLCPEQIHSCIVDVQIDYSPSQCGFAGDHINTTVTGMDINNMAIGMF